jgi:hypothetical protein
MTHSQREGARLQSRLQQIKSQAFNNQQVSEDDRFNHDNCFIVCTEYSIVLFYYYDGNFLTNETYLDLHGITSAITCVAAVRITRAVAESENIPEP